jgi:hypothetical protein
LVYLFYHQPLFYTLYLPLLLIAILAGGGILRHVWVNSTRTWTSVLTFRIGMISAALGFLVMVAGSYFSTFPAALGDVLLVITSITALTPEGTGSPGITSVAELVRQHYTSYRNAGLLILLVILPVFSLVAGGLVTLLVRFVANRAPKRSPATR